MGSVTLHPFVVYSDFLYILLKFGKLGKYMGIF